MNEATNFNNFPAETLRLPDLPQEFERQQRNEALATKRARNVEWTKKMIWAYFWLLIFEGVLRKWILPSYSTPLTIIRDPVVMVIYFFAWRSGALSRNIFIPTLVVIAFSSLIISLFLPSSSMLTAFYGFRSSFLHLPLIFIMGRVFNMEDVKRFGYWILVLSVPLAILMVLQFLAPRTSIINAGLSGDFEQIYGAGGKIRPPATFSFVTGPIYFFGLVAVFLFNEQFSRAGEHQPKTLIIFSIAALLLAMSVSISRSLIANVGLVFIFAFIGVIFFQPKYLLRWLAGIFIMAILFVGASSVPLVNMGFRLLLARSEGAAQQNGRSVVGLDMADRVVYEFTQPVGAVFEAPLLGHGLGLGTNGGAAFAPPNAFFISQEGEWTRNVLECGPILGGAFILWRVCLTLFLAWTVMRCAKRGNILPLLLFAICGVLILYGIFPQPTALGFAAFTSGLCLASMKKPRRGLLKSY